MVRIPAFAKASAWQAGFRKVGAWSESPKATETCRLRVQGFAKGYAVVSGVQGCWCENPFSHPFGRRILSPPIVAG